MAILHGDLSYILMTATVLTKAEESFKIEIENCFILVHMVLSVPTGKLYQMNFNLFIQLYFITLYCC